MIDWVLHLPARGSVYAEHAGGRASRVAFDNGELRAGSRELGLRSGAGMTERWVPNTSTEEDAPAGRIELFTTYVGRLEPLETEETVE